MSIHHSRIFLISVAAVEAVIIFVLLIAFIVSAKHGSFYNFLALLFYIIANFIYASEKRNNCRPIIQSKLTAIYC